MIQFLESFYVLAVIPFQLNGAGYDSRVAVIGTCTACCVGCIVSGLFTDLPFMLAPSVAVSIFFAVSMERANLTPEHGSASLIISGFMLCLLGVLPPVDRFLTGVRLNISIPRIPHDYQTNRMNQWFVDHSRCHPSSGFDWSWSDHLLGWLDEHRFDSER